MSLFMIPWALVLCYYAFDYAMTSWQYSESSSQPNGLPARYVIKFVMAAGFLLLIIQGLSEIIRWGVRKKG